VLLTAVVGATASDRDDSAGFVCADAGNGGVTIGGGVVTGLVPIGGGVPAAGGVAAAVAGFAVAAFAGAAEMRSSSAARRRTDSLIATGSRGAPGAAEVTAIRTRGSTARTSSSSLSPARACIAFAFYLDGRASVRQLGDDLRLKHLPYLAGSQPRRVAREFHGRRRRRPQRKRGARFQRQDFELQRVADAYGHGELHLEGRALDVHDRAAVRQLRDHLRAKHPPDRVLRQAFCRPLDFDERLGARSQHASERIPQGRQAGHSHSGPGDGEDNGHSRTFAQSARQIK
jgi:hypothetical protein